MSRLLTVGLVAVFTSGCVPVTVPVGDVDKGEPDKGLVGEWTVTRFRGQDDPLDITSLTVDVPAVKGNPKGLMRVDSGGAEAWSGKLWFYLTTVGKHRYAVVCAAPLGEAPPQFDKEGRFAKWQEGNKAYWVFRYALDGDALTIDPGNHTVVIEQMADADIPGDGGKYFKVFSPSADWLAKHYGKPDVDKIYDGTNALKLKRKK